MRFFLAGIMQGSHLALTLHPQGYRGHLRDLLIRYLPGCEVYDPLTDHGESLGYDDARGREVFFRHCGMCRQVDVVLAFVPEASMGTAIEMWEAHQQGRIVITVSPLAHNWVVKFLSHAVYPDLAALEDALACGDFSRLVEKLQSDLATPDPRAAE